MLDRDKIVIHEVVESLNFYSLAMAPMAYDWSQFQIAFPAHTLKISRKPKSQLELPFLSVHNSIQCHSGSMTQKPLVATFHH